MKEKTEKVQVLTDSSILQILHADTLDKSILKHSSAIVNSIESKRISKARIGLLDLNITK